MYNENETVAIVERNNENEIIYIHLVFNSFHFT